MKESILKSYIKSYLITEGDDTNSYVDISSQGYSYKELYDFLRYIDSGRNIKGALKFATSVLGATGVESVLDLGSGAFSKISEEAAGEAMSKFLSYLKIPNVKSPIKALAKFYGVNDLQGLKGIAIPNNISNLIDNKVEALFIKHLLRLLEIKAKKSPDAIVDSDFMLRNLKDFTMNYDKTKDAYVAIK